MTGLAGSAALVPAVARAEARQGRASEITPGGVARGSEQAMAALRRDLGPELLGRIGRGVVSESMTRPVQRRFAGKPAARVRARLAFRAITFTPTDDACELLVRRSGQARPGAHGLEQAVERLLVQPLGRAMVTGQFSDGTPIRGEAVDSALVSTPHKSGGTAR